MSARGLPGFAAEASIYVAAASYRGVAAAPGQVGAVVPAARPIGCGCGMKECCCSGPWGTYACCARDGSGCYGGVL